MNISFQHKLHVSARHVNMSNVQNAPLQKHEPQTDSISIGSQARQLFNQHLQSSSLVESLMKQRDTIQEMKANLTERALEQGTSPSGLKEQMKTFEQQLADIDAQIAQAQKEKQEPASTRLQEQPPQTAEEAIFSQATSLEQTKTLQRMDRSLSREQASLESEMKLDAIRGVRSENKANRLTKIEDQIAFVKETLTTQVTETPAVNAKQNDDQLTVQQQLDNIMKGDEEADETAQA